MKDGNTKFIMCESDDGPVCINIAQIAYFRKDLDTRVVVMMNSGINARIVVNETMEKFICMIEAALG